MGVENIITFDAHDPRVQNSIPLKGFETVQPIYQFLKHLLKNEPDLQIDSDHMMVISPDEGGASRASTSQICWDWIWVCSISAVITPRS